MLFTLYRLSKWTNIRCTQEARDPFSAILRERWCSQLASAWPGNVPSPTLPKKRHATSICELSHWDKLSCETNMSFHKMNKTRNSHHDHVCSSRVEKDKSEPSPGLGQSLLLELEVDKKLSRKKTPNCLSWHDIHNLLLNRLNLPFLEKGYKTTFSQKIWDPRLQTHILRHGWEIPLAQLGISTRDFNLRSSSLIFQVTRVAELGVLSCQVAQVSLSMLLIFNALPSLHTLRGANMNFITSFFLLVTVPDALLIEEQARVREAWCRWCGLRCTVGCSSELGKCGRNSQHPVEPQENERTRLPPLHTSLLHSY